MRADAGCRLDMVLQRRLAFLASLGRPLAAEHPDVGRTLRALHCFDSAGSSRLVHLACCGVMVRHLAGSKPQALQRSQDNRSRGWRHRVPVGSLGGAPANNSGGMEGTCLSRIVRLPSRRPSVASLSFAPAAECQYRWADERCLKYTSNPISRLKRTLPLRCARGPSSDRVRAMQSNLPHLTGPKLYRLFSSSELLMRGPTSASRPQRLVPSLTGFSDASHTPSLRTVTTS